MQYNDLMISSMCVRTCACVCTFGCVGVNLVYVCVCVCVVHACGVRVCVHACCKARRDLKGNIGDDMVNPSTA